VAGCTQKAAPQVIIEPTTEIPNRLPDAEPPEPLFPANSVIMLSDSEKTVATWDRRSPLEFRNYELATVFKIHNGKVTKIRIHDIDAIQPSEAELGDVLRIKCAKVHYCHGEVTVL
jgi:hypothetical protein